MTDAPQTAGKKRTASAEWYKHAFHYLGTLAILVLATGTVVYHFVEDWSWVDSFYFSSVALTTVGFGDLTPTTGTVRNCSPSSTSSPASRSSGRFSTRLLKGTCREGRRSPLGRLAPRAIRIRRSDHDRLDACSLDERGLGHDSSRQDSRRSPGLRAVEPFRKGSRSPERHGRRRFPPGHAQRW